MQATDACSTAIALVRKTAGERAGMPTAALIRRDREALEARKADAEAMAAVRGALGLKPGAPPEKVRGVGTHG